MKIKLKYLLVFIVALGMMSVFIGTGAAEDGPYVYIRYFNNGTGVDAYVYWDDSAANGGPYNFAWADDVLSSCDDLDWQAGSPDNAGTADAVFKLSVTKYINYFFKVSSGDKVTIARAFPLDFNNTANSYRYENDYAHGNFAPGTGMCATCHITHTALGGYLLKQATYYELCLLCHGSSSTQSKYDVETGKVYMGPETGWVDSLAGPIGSGVTTIISKHDVDDTGDVMTTVYGSDPARMLTFTCVSCHNGHSGKNDNYRLLKKTIYPADGGWNPQTVVFNAYAVVKDITVGEDVYYISGNSEFCAACHLDYDEGTAYYADGEYTSFYKHPVTVGSTIYSVEDREIWPTAGDYLPLQVDPGAGTTDKRNAVVCGTCHFAHGTYKIFNVYLPETGETISSQKMLRLDNYGVCESCHKK
ncbi:cytochrome c3 family protein [Phosphitispora sp. TUW77]|uniref:cytochrome c3 family protein n=1 Tax=Phosphitispora sp. TUW77 TaxID=3152361 RepID=UPI003AB6C374